MKPVTAAEIQFKTDAVETTTIHIEEDGAMDTAKELLCIFNSMTHEEYTNPKLLINSSRATRVKYGCMKSKEVVEDAAKLLYDIENVSKKVLWNWLNINLTFNPTCDVYSKTLKPTMDNPAAFESQMKAITEQSIKDMKEVNFLVNITLINFFSEASVQLHSEIESRKDILEERHNVANPVIVKFFSRHEYIDNTLSRDKKEQLEQTVQDISSKFDGTANSTIIDH